MQSNRRQSRSIVWRKGDEKAKAAAKPAPAVIGDSGQAGWGGSYNSDLDLKQEHKSS
jgi:hypothetical protein